MGNHKHLTEEEAANVLTFLSWHEPLRGVVPCDERRGQIEAGRASILDWLAAGLRAEVTHE